MSRIAGITIEIDGDTTKLNKALSNTNKEIRDTQSQLREVERGLKFQPGNTELMGQKFKLLNTQVDETKKKLATLKEADKQAKQQLANGEIGQDQYDALRREIIKTEDQLKSLQKEAENTGKALSGQGWTEAGQKLEKFGGKLTNVGNTLTKKVTAPITAVGVASGAAWKEIDTALDGIVTATGKTGDEFEALKGTFDNVFGSMPASAETVGKAIGELDTQFGDAIDNMDEATKSVVQFADINGTDVVNSIQGAKKSMDMFGLGANDLQAALDTVTLASQNTGVSTDKIFESMRTNAPILKDMGVGYHESALMIAEMEKSGLNADQVLKGLQKGQITAAKSGETLNDAVGKLQTSMEGGASRTELLAQAAEIFGTKNAPIMLEALEKGVLNFDEFAAAADGAAGTVSDTFEATLDPIDQAKIAINNLKTLGAEIFNAVQAVVAPMLENLVAKLKAATQWFQNLSPEMQTLIVKIGLLAAAAGPILSIGGKFISGAGKVMTTIGSLGGAFGATSSVISTAGKAIGMVFSPTGLMIGAIAGAAVLIIRHWDDIKAAAGKLAEGISKAWDNVKNWTTEKWNNVKDKISSTWDGIKTVASNGAEKVKSSVSNAWNGLKGTAANIWNGIKSHVSNTWEGIKSVASNGANHVKSGVSNAWNGLKSVSSTVWNGIKGTVSGVWGGMKNAAQIGAQNVANAVTNVWHGLKDTTARLWDNITNIASNAWNGVKNWASNAWNTVTGGGGGGAGRTRITTGAEEFLQPQSLWNSMFPGLQWFDKGGIFAGPQVIGVGEKRPEAVGALDDIKSIFLDALKDFAQTARGNQQPVLVTGNSFTVREEADIDKIAASLYQKIKQAERSF